MDDKKNQIYINKQHPEKMQKYPILLLIIALCTLTCAVQLQADEPKDIIPYKLALLHTRHESPEEALVNESLEPSHAILAEFQWIMASLRNRCLNPEGVIASTIVESWEIVRKWDVEEMSLLDITRALNKTAQNKSFFGYEKINFRMTTNYWLTQHKPKKGNQAVGQFK